MNNKELYKPIFAEIGEITEESLKRRKEILKDQEIPIEEIIKLLENLIDLVGNDYGKGCYFEMQGEFMEPLILKAKEILEILL